MVLADGCFDPMHVGHVAYLTEAKELADALQTTLAVRIERTQAKGRGQFQSVEERQGMIRRLVSSHVQFVPDGTLAETIRLSQPEFLVKGVEWEGSLPADVRSACRDAGTHIVYTQTRMKSSTERLHDVGII